MPEAIPPKRLTDSFGRQIRYLRLSVTDRCNLRCVYCLPESYSRFASPEEVMTSEEVLRLADIFAQLGISSVRLTGGEPLVRPDIVPLVQGLAQVPGISDLSLSTNGMLLPHTAYDLARAGLKRVNISLDSLIPQKFSGITRLGHLKNVLEGIDCALEAGFSPVKLNVVIARGMNDDEVSDFVNLTEKIPVHVRFIELMPMGEAGFFSKDKWVSMREMLEKVPELMPMPQAEWPQGLGPARYFKVPGAKGTVGFISALGCGFCSLCNRMRLSSRGVLYPCLDAGEGTDLLSLVREGVDDDELSRLIFETVRRKPERHSMQERMELSGPNPRTMCQIGG